jgi:hypothetical protein
MLYSSLSRTFVLKDEEAKTLITLFVYDIDIFDGPKL